MMFKIDKLVSYVLLIIILGLFFINGKYGIVIAFFAFSFVLVTEKKLIKMFLKPGFIIFIIIMLVTPLLVDCSFGNFLSNLFILLRGILVFIWLYFYTKNISSSSVYRIIKKVLPEELIFLVSVSYTIIPVMQKEALNTVDKLRKRRISITDSFTEFFYTTIEMAETMTPKFIKNKRCKKIFVITGDAHKGKTTLLKRVIEQAVDSGCKVGGVVLEYQENNEDEREYYAIDIKTGEKVRFATTEDVTVPNEKFYIYRFIKSALDFASKALSVEYLGAIDVVAVDEVGLFELRGGGHAERIPQILCSEIPIIIFVVREKYLKKVLKKFDINPSKVIRVGQNIDGWWNREVGFYSKE